MGDSVHYPCEHESASPLNSLLTAYNFYSQPMPCLKLTGKIQQLILKIYLTEYHNLDSVQFTLFEREANYSVTNFEGSGFFTTSEKFT